ncbi:MAG TPA: DUF1206 domain-containing protein [Thermoanaerobaculia bacterium]|jgi:hypothetical protein|nr:DUF1206 domain-containing protein [Thermoanaerobaculia bacterium]
MIENFARLGYAAKGLVYATIGFLTALAGLHRGGTAADRKDAIRFIGQQPFGRALLCIVAAGLLGYALWRVLSGITDSDRHGRELKGLAVRTGSIVRGLFYAAFALVVLRYLLHKGGAGQSSDAASRHWTARALDVPFGRFAVAAAGLGLIGYGIYQFSRAVRGKLSKHLAAIQSRRTLVVLSCFGIAARAVIFATIGVSLVRAAQHRAASAARGSSGALRELARLPMGSWILTVAGLGLIAYGVYAFINARYRRIRTA